VSKKRVKVSSLVSKERKEKRKMRAVSCVGFKASLVLVSIHIDFYEHS
jgi:hypothetical protein